MAPRPGRGNGADQPASRGKWGKRAHSGLAIDGRMLGENMALNEMERLLRRLLPFATLLALLPASASAADAPAAPDPEIARLVSGVSPERLEAYVRALAGFGTRHSLS